MILLLELIGRALIYLAPFTHSVQCSRSALVEIKELLAGNWLFQSKVQQAVQWSFRTPGLVNHQIFNLNAVKEFFLLYMKGTFISALPYFSK